MQQWRREVVVVGGVTARKEFGSTMGSRVVLIAGLRGGHPARPHLLQQDGKRVSGIPYYTSPAVAPGAPFPPGLPLPPRRASSSPPLPAGSPWRGSLEVSSEMSSGNPAARVPARTPRRAAHSHSAHAGGGAARCVSSGVVRLDDWGSPAPGVAFRGAPEGLPLPAPYFMPEKPMSRLKTFCKSSRKILSRNLYLQNA